MAATLASIEAALFAALRTLAPASQGGNGTFALVERHAGELTREGIFHAFLGHPTAALLAFEDETPVEVEEVRTLALRRVSLRAESTWLVIVGVTDARGDEAGTVSITGQPGALELAGKVAAKLNGLVVSGLSDGALVTYARTRPAVIDRGSGLYTYALRFTASRTVEQAAVVDDSVPLLEIRTDVNALPAADTQFPNPVSSTIANTSA